MGLSAAKNWIKVSSKWFQCIIVIVITIIYYLLALAFSDTQKIKEDKNDKRYQVFVSFRFSEAEVEAKEVKRQLELRGVSTFVCNVAEGVSIETEVYFMYFITVNIIFKFI